MTGVCDDRNGLEGPARIVVGHEEVSEPQGDRAERLVAVARLTSVIGKRAGGAAQKRAESVTSDERRRALEALALNSDEAVQCDPILLCSFGSAAVDPVGERYPGEESALMNLVREYRPHTGFDLGVLCDVCLEIWNCAESGTQASRTALIRALAAFLMNDLATSLALRGR